MNPKYLTYCNKEYVMWVKYQDCCACGAKGPGDPHHVFHSNRNDYRAIPMCRKCHSECHAVGENTFQTVENVDFRDQIEIHMGKYINDHA